MLVIPEVGFRRSVHEHNCNLAIVCDWIEASLLNDETEISQALICDILREQQYYPRLEDIEEHTVTTILGGSHQDDFCAEYVETVWAELKRRARLANKACFYTVSEKRVTRRCGWDECAPGAFLLLLTCGEYYEALRESADYVKQGELFEDFCCEALRANGWEASRTGWASHKGAQKLSKAVKSVAAALGENDIRTQAVHRARKKNEAGCDLVSHWAYSDEWTGRPIILLQCASGADFKKKLGTPNLDEWRQFISFSSIPIRGFCTPRAFKKNDFLLHCQQVNGLLLERYRLLEPFASAPEKLSQLLDKRLVEWAGPPIKVLPKLR